MSYRSGTQLNSAVFLGRYLVTFPASDDNDVYIYCHICKEDKLVKRKKRDVYIECQHLIPCGECRDYNMEKILRCKECCESVTDRFIEGCCDTCPRNEDTAKVSALCVVCDKPMRKEAKCCRNSDSIRKLKKEIRQRTVVFVQNPYLVENPCSKDRPCSHFSLCQYCKQSIVKGHRTTTACKSCKAKLTDGRISPKKKRSRIQFCMESGINQYTPPPKKQFLPPRQATLYNIVNDTEPHITEPNIENRFGEGCRIPVSALLI